MGALALFIAVLGADAGPDATVMVAMRDGVRLATDVYVPSEGEPPYPAVLVRTPYGRFEARDEARAYASRGLLYVVQDTRGNFDSEGESLGFFHDGWGTWRDGADTVAWLKSLPLCDGRIATRGNSARGITQTLLAGATQDVACQFIGQSATDPYSDILFPGGVYRLLLVEGWATFVQVRHALPLFKGRPAYDGFWRGFDAAERAPFITAPAVHWGGWYDIFLSGTITGFQSRQHNGGPGARGNQKLVIGPWTHWSTPEDGARRYSDDASFDLPGYEARWFEYWLEGVDNGVMDEPAVRYYVMGDLVNPLAPGNEWRTAEDWPPFPLVEGVWRPTPGGGLSLAPNRRGGAATYVFDPYDPVITVGGQNLFMPPGPLNQALAGERPDILRFETGPLPHPVEATGPVRAVVEVSTDAPDTDFTAKLVDIYPAGREMLVCDGIARLRYRSGMEQADFAAPGERSVLEIDLGHTSLIFNEGHRIGLHISSSNFPRFEVNPNTGADYPEDGPMRAAVNTVYLGGDAATALRLPRPDRNRNGLPDDWEAFAAHKAAGDDGDGLSFAEEAALGTDPASGDSDGDGVLDGRELAHGTDPLDPRDSRGDLDRDGAVTAIDLQLVVGAILGASRPGTLTDLDGDGAVTSIDVQLVTRDLFGLGG